MNMSSAWPSEMIWTFAPALGRHVLAAFDTTILKLMWSSSAAGAEPAVMNISAEPRTAALTAYRYIALSPEFDGLDTGNPRPRHSHMSVCPGSAPMRQKWRVEDGRFSGPSYLLNQRRCDKMPGRQRKRLS